MSLLRNTAAGRLDKIVERSKDNDKMKSRNSPTFDSTSTPSPSQDSQNTDKEKIILGCICSRVKGNVLCTLCGWMGPGRVRFVCPAHPRTLYLMDFDQCPKCRAYPPLIKEIIL